METIQYADFEKVHIVSGTVVKVEAFPEARKPAYQVWVDFGNAVGVKKTSAQITQHYTEETLLGKQVMGVINFPAKQIAHVRSEFLLLGFESEEGGIILAQPERLIPTGRRLH